ncbi:MAG: hypothetical protein K9M98_14290 [Cephaloticoccus sp.]|nr:hypothetical protein [Cephaloticoccus sp.]MCF7761664.1 hypothetical protein [Cephaloticoccus sp.]
MKDLASNTTKALQGRGVAVACWKWALCCVASYVVRESDLGLTPHKRIAHYVDGFITPFPNDFTNRVRWLACALNGQFTLGREDSCSQSVSDHAEHYIQLFNGNNLSAGSIPARASNFH